MNLYTMKLEYTDEASFFQVGDSFGGLTVRAIDRAMCTMTVECSKTYEAAEEAVQDELGSRRAKQ